MSTPNLSNFDASQYLKKNPDLVTALPKHPEFSIYSDPLKAATEHYKKYGYAEGRETGPSYSTGEQDRDSIQGLTDDDSFKVGQFEELLNRLEGSKKRQQRQRSVEGRRDIFAQGLAGMMDNF